MLVWTFILERTVVVYLASTYPKNDLQSRGRFTSASFARLRVLLEQRR